MNSTDSAEGLTLNGEIILRAARDYNSRKYAENFRDHFLDILQKATYYTPNVKRAIEYLLFWKLGKVLQHSSPTSSVLDYRDSEGNPYFTAGITKSNKAIIERAMSEELVQKGLAFRDKAIDYSEFKEVVSRLTKTSIVLRAFYVHIWSPATYPILDEKVWKIYLCTSGRPVGRYTKPSNWSDYEEYTDFFRDLVQGTELDSRIIDKGLWVLGDGLKSELGSATEKVPTSRIRGRLERVDVEKSYKCFEILYRRLEVNAVELPYSTERSKHFRARGRPYIKGPQKGDKHILFQGVEKTNSRIYCTKYDFNNSLRTGCRYTTGGTLLYHALVPLINYLAVEDDDFKACLSETYGITLPWHPGKPSRGLR